MPAGTDLERLRAARARLFDRIEVAAAAVGRDPGAIRLVAVSKGFDAASVEAALEAGLTLFGENRVQEAATKIGQVRGCTWHLIGPLQSNKARRAVELFDAIESVDSVDLARRVDRLAAEVRPGRPMPVLLQVNVDADPAKAGFSPTALTDALGALLDLPNLRVEGLMTVGRLTDGPEAAQPTFRALRQLSERLRADDPRLGTELSMGMSSDYPVAIEEGATLIRVGRAIFGERPTAH